MGIYRGAGGTGDAVNDASSEATLVQSLVSGATTQANNAATSATAAQAASTQAAISQGLAADSATAAATAETNAETAETNAETAQAAAEAAQAAAETAQTAAELAETNAETAETNAETAQAAAATSATNASNSASAASTSATNASNSASAASTSATNASNSASAASTSASNASTSATAAASSASAASTSASNASTSATNASNSATSASTSASTATTQAGIATTQASNASTSATNASNSASAASTSATNASNSATAAAGSATTASSAADAALAALDSFDDRYLGQKSTAPTVDNDGNALVAGALYFNTTTNEMKVYDGSNWLNAYASLSGALLATSNLSDLNNTATARTNLGVAIGTNVQAWDADLDTWATKTAPSGTVVGTSDSQTLTTKTIALGSNTVSGTLAQFNTAVTDADLVSLAGTETLSNKTLTSPTLTTPALGTPASGVVTNLTGTASININGTVGATTPAAGTFTSLSDSGNLTFTGTGNRITGDFSNATNASRVAFQTSTTNGNTIVNIIPNGTASRSDIRLFSSSDPDNASALIIGASVVGEARINSTATGTGTNLPLTMYTGGSERLRIDTSGNVGIGTSSPSYRLDNVQNVNGTSTIATQNANTGANATARFLAISDGGNAQLAACGTGYTDVTGAADSMMLNANSMSNGMVFAIDGVIRAKLDSSGNLGIGTSSPSYKLQTIGTGAFSNNGSENLYLIDTTNVSRASLQVSGAVNYFNTNIDSASQGQFIWRSSNAYTERMRITSAGEVGIGATATNRLNLTYDGASGVATVGPNSTGGSTLLTLGTSNAGTYAERMRIDSSGNVGIGNTPSAWDTGNGVKALQLGVSGTTSLWNFSTTVSVLGQNAFWNGTNRIYNTTNFATEYTQSAGIHIWYSAPSGTAGTACTFTERMRIASDGVVLIGKTSSASDVTTVGCLIQQAGKAVFTTSADQSLVLAGTGTATRNLQEFFINGSTVGAISCSTTATSYVTSSDYRLKENIAPMTGALATVQALKPVTYNWKVDGSDGQGFIAHELQAVVPECVTGEKDAVDAEGKPVYQGIDTSFLVATLTAAIQEQQKLIENLTTRLNTLEGK